MVKKKICTLQVIMVCLLLFGWLFSIIVVVSEDAVRSQNLLVAQARVFLEDKLYMRAAKIYRQALSEYQTEQNFALETELLSVYKEAGKEEAYYGLIQDRLENGTAGAEEYKAIAEYYISMGREKNAVPILQQGIAQYDDVSLKELYEKIRYRIGQLDTVYSVCGIPSAQWLIPVKDQGLWGYVDEDGRGVLDFCYEEAYPFSDEYSIVKLDGVYTLIDVQGDRYAVDKAGIEEVTSYAGKLLVGKIGEKCGLYSRTFTPITDCIYEDAILSDNGLCFVKSGGKWGLIDAAGKEVLDFRYLDVAKNSRNQAFADHYAIVKDEGGYFAVDENGRAVSDVRFADAKGMEGGCYAVADATGKWGFSDIAGEVVVDFLYSDAWSFSDSVAAVLYGGKWGYINSSGEMVVEEHFEEAHPFWHGKALVKELGYYQILNLQYYELLVG